METDPFDRAQDEATCSIDAGALGQLVLRKSRTFIYLYENSAYNHLEVFLEDGDRQGFIVPQEQLDEMLVAGYYPIINKKPSESVYEWFIEATMSDMDEDLGHLEDH